MNDIAFVRISDCRRQLLDPARGYSGRRVGGARSHPMRQRRSLNVLHCGVEDRPDFASFQNSHDVRMVEFSSGAHFGQAAPPQRGVAQRLRARHLQRNIPCQQRIKSQIDVAKTAAAQFRQDLESTYGLAVHRRRLDESARLLTKH